MRRHSAIQPQGRHNGGKSGAAWDPRDKAPLNRMGCIVPAAITSTARGH